MLHRARSSINEINGPAEVGWPNYVASLSLCLVGGLIGDRAYELVNVFIDRLARLANGMDPLPLTLYDGWRMARHLPRDWWVVMLICLVAGIGLVFCRSRDVEKSLKFFCWLLASVVLFRFVIEGHVPIHGLDLKDYGIAHYTIYQLGFLVESLMIVGGAWLAAACGWYFMLHKDDRLFEGSR